MGEPQAELCPATQHYIEVGGGGWGVGRGGGGGFDKRPKNFAIILAQHVSETGNILWNQQVDDKREPLVISYSERERLLNSVLKKPHLCRAEQKLVMNQLGFSVEKLDNKGVDQRCSAGGDLPIPICNKLDVCLISSL